MQFFEELKWRGLIQQVSDPRLESMMNKGGLSVYCGFDPTADSLHVGSLLQIVNLMRLQKAGHSPIAVVGGATGMIGDPSGKTQERNLLDQNSLQKNLEGIRKQLDRFLDFKSGNGAALVNNAEWFQGVSYIDFLRDIGKHFSVNMMLGKESVRARLEDRDQGISYTEFSYMLLQSYDFLSLFDSHGCTLQIGGSDQWGNIVAGIDLIRRLRQKEAFGLTFPLVMKSDGTKFGKSEKGNVWLDSARTSPYEFYQFFIQVDDKDVLQLLKYYTFLSPSDIDALAQRIATAPEKREAQRVLAHELTTLVHGASETDAAEKAAGALFEKNLSELDRGSIQRLFVDAPQTSIAREILLKGQCTLIDLLAQTGLCTSKGNARKDVTGGGIYLNDVRQTEAGLVITKDHLLHDELIVLRKGKKTYHIVRFQ